MCLVSDSHVAQAGLKVRCVSEDDLELVALLPHLPVTDVYQGTQCMWSWGFHSDLVSTSPLSYAPSLLLEILIKIPAQKGQSRPRKSGVSVSWLQLFFPHYLAE